MATVGLSTYKPSGNSETKTLGELKDSVKTDLKKQKLLKEKDTVKISDSSKELREELNKLTNENKKLDPAKAVEKIHQSKFGNLQKPALFFISGFDWFGASSVKGNYDGIRDMANAIKGGQHYAWDEKEEMIEAIKKRTQDQPIILVGHSFGADTAIEIAQELNNIESGFRSIDLLITLDSVGFNNDFIPQNVKKNLNYLATDNRLINDGPNIAIDYNRTKVQNFLRTEAHAGLDDATDIQITVLEEVQKALS
jgi:hypothetical protein